MTSKEALERIKNTIIVRRNNTVVLEPFIQEEIETIAKDLEVLEILKKRIEINETYDDLFPYEIKVKSGYISNRSCLVLTEEDFKKIKEWLE